MENISNATVRASPTYKPNSAGEPSAITRHVTFPVKKRCLLRC